MKKEYWMILIVYFLMQFSSVIGVPAIKFLGVNQSLAYPVWIVTKFILAFMVILFILRKELTDLSFNKKHKTFKFSIKWALLGVLLVFLSQYAAATIERLLGVNLASENTQQLTHIINSFPIVIIVSSIFGPVLEEIVFRRILFGYFHKHLNFFIAAIISSFIFALAHLEPEHIIRYSAIGFVFAFLYVKRNNIISPIFAHVMMNTIIIIFQKG